MNLRKALAIAAVALVVYTFHLGRQSAPEPKPRSAPAPEPEARAEAAQYFGEANWDLEAAADEAEMEPVVPAPTLLEMELMEAEGAEGRAVR